MHITIIVFLLVCQYVRSSVINVDSQDEYKSYKGYKVIEVVPATNDQLDVVHELTQDTQLDFWTAWHLTSHPAHFMVPSDIAEGVIRFIQDNGMEAAILNDDIGKQVEEERSRLELRKSDNLAFNYDDFNTYDQIMTELDDLAARCDPSLTCTVETLGYSHDGQAIKVLRIVSGTEGQPGFWFDSAIHAREWLAPATVLKIINHFVSNYSIDPEVTYYLDSYDWHFVPIMNPDGYEYSWTNDRYWRKSRNNNTDSECMGTDLNRNYDSHWMNNGASSSPCTDLYGGSGPASEPETQVIQTEIVRLGPTLAALVSVHTPAQMWLHPWGYGEGGRCARAPDHEDMYLVADAAANATEDTYGTTWPRGTICETIYPASGTSCDYAKEVGDIKYSFTPELRGPDFVVEPVLIDVSYHEFYNGIRAMIDQLETIA